MTSENLNLDFVNFVKNKKHAKPDNDDLYEIDFLGRKKEGISFNDTNRNEVKKLKIKDGEISLADFLTKNKNRIIEEPKRKKSKDIEKKKEKEEKESENNEDEINENISYDESEDYSEERINHYIGHKNKKHDLDEIEETIKEIQKRSQRFQNSIKNKNESNIQDSKESEKESIEDNVEVKKINKRKEEKNNKNKEKKGKRKEFKSNISNTIFIGNLPENISEKELKKKFDKFGIIKNIRLIEDKKGKIKNFGYIDYETEKAMMSAVNSTINIKEHEIKIEKAKSSFFEGIDHTGSLLNNDNIGRVGKKKQKAIINKAKENMKKNKDK